MSAAWRERLALAGVLILAAALRLHALDRSAYWSDEFASLVASNGQLVWANQPRPGSFPPTRPRPTRIADALPTPQIAYALVEDNHPPLYFLVLRGWRWRFGDDERATRSLSVLASLCALALFFDGVRSLLGSTAGLWAALLLAVALPDIALARETRSYSLLLLCLMAAVAALARLEARGAGPRRAVLLAVAALAAMLTHYFAAFALGPLAVHACFRLEKAARRQALLALLLAAGVFLAAWGPFVWYSRQAAVENADWLAAVGSTPSAQTLARLAGLPWRLLAGPIWAQTPGAAWPAALYLGALAVVWRRPRALLWFALFVGVIGFVVALDLTRETRQLVVLRYVLPATPAACALLAACAAAGGRLLRHAVPAAAGLALLLNVPAAYPQPEAHWRRLVRILERSAGPNQPLALTFRDRDMPQLYRAFNHYGVGPRRLFVFTRQPSPLALSRLPRASSFWLISDADPLALIPGCRIEEQLDRAGLPSAYRLTLAGLVPAT